MQKVAVIQGLQTQIVKLQIPFGLERGPQPLQVKLKQLFKVSAAAIVVRCRQLDIISGAVYARLWAQIKALNWNGPDTKEPCPIAKEEPMRMQRLCFRPVAEGAISEAKAASLLRITTHSLDRQLSAKEPVAA